MRRLWLIATGEYSDYTAVALAESEERAEALAALMSADEEPWPRHFYVSGRLTVYGDDDPPPEKAETFDAYISGGKPVAVYRNVRWPHEAEESSVRRGGNAKFPSWHASDYPTEQAAIDAVQALKAADEHNHTAGG